MGFYFHYCLVLEPHYPKELNPHAPKLTDTLCGTDNMIGRGSAFHDFR